MNSLLFKIRDMDCPEEVALLTRALLPLVVQESRLDYNLLQRRLRVDVTDLAVSREQLLQAIRATGMRGEPIEEAAASCTCCTGTCPAQGTFWQRRGRNLLCAASGLLWAAGLGLMASERGSLLAVFSQSGTASPAIKTLWILAALSGLFHVLPKAAYSLRTMRPDMNLLMALAVGGAMAIGEYSEGACVAFLFALANQLEAWSAGRARNAIQALMRLAPDKALVLRPATSMPVETPVEAVVPGTRILVRPGDRVPLDGIIRMGTSAVDQSPITGESMPVSKTPGDAVYAGTINSEGALEVETTQPASQSTLARIMLMVEEAQSRRAKSLQWVEKFAAVYTPVMMTIAFLFAVAPPLFAGERWSTWIYEALVILVISCPCALVISTPVGIVAGLAAAARNGVLIKGGVYLEVPATLNAMVFDKTGTLTSGRPKVVTVTPLGGTSQTRLLEIAAALESRSTHPVAQAIMRHALSTGITPATIENDHARPGLGAQGSIDGQPYSIGNSRFLAAPGNAPTAIGLEEALQREQPPAGTRVFVWTTGKVLGCITVEDTLKPHSRSALAALRKAGVDTLVMLTGDNARTAAKIAAEAGVTRFHSELLPEDKTRMVEELVRSGNRVAMVGDGVNDAPALASAHLGIAMGPIGTDVAMETADVALMSGDLAKLPWLIRHSRRTLRIIKTNIWLALGIKTVFLLLAAFQMATLWMAILADLGTSLFVIFNGLRLLRGKT